MKPIYQFALTLLVSTFFNLASAQTSQPNYQFDELKTVTSIRASDVNGWGRINDQVLVVSATPSKKYILVLARTDRDLSFSHAIGVTSSAGRVQAKFDGVYAGNNSIHIENRITRIYEVKGKAAMKHARALFELRECESGKENNCDKFQKAVVDTKQQDHGK